MTVDIRPPSPGTATSALGSYPKRILRAAPGSERDWVALHEAARGAARGAPSRAALERRRGDAPGAADTRDARVEPQARDPGVRVPGVGEDRDPGAPAVEPPAHERARVERRLQQPGRMQRERDGAGAVRTSGDVELQVVPAAVAVRQLLHRVRC